MAIFGALRDLPLVDLLSMLGRGAGLLHVWHAGGKRNRYVLALDRGKLLWMKDDQGYLDPLKARSALLELASAHWGAFEFTPVEPPRGSPPLNWPLEQILLSVITISDELASYNSLLPDPRTRFQTAALEVWLEEPLRSFWERAHPLLQAGASAEDLAYRLRLPLDEVRYYLRKLHLTGVVTPMRAHQTVRQDTKRRGLFQRLLAALRGRREAGEAPLAGREPGDYSSPTLFSLKRAVLDEMLR